MIVKIVLQLKYMQFPLRDTLDDLTADSVGAIYNEVKNEYMSPKVLSVSSVED